MGHTAHFRKLTSPRGGGPGGGPGGGDGATLYMLCWVLIKNHTQQSLLMVLIHSINFGI